jgi:hypothetical protein
MIEIEGNRLYWNGLFTCYASHQISADVVTSVSVMFSHRHSRVLLNAGGKYWIGSNDGSLPNPDIVVGHVVGPNGLLPDPASMERLIELVQVRDDDGLQTRLRITQ